VIPVIEAPCRAIATQNGPTPTARRLLTREGGTVAPSAPPATTYYARRTSSGRALCAQADHRVGPRRSTCIAQPGGDPFP
jgi:hypothetical protein